MIMVCCTACSGSTSPSARRNTPTSATATATTASISKLPCHGDRAALPDDFTVVFDAVALPTSDNYLYALQTSSQHDEPGLRLFAKTGLWYRPDHRFTIAVPDNLTGQLGIGWGGNPSSPEPGIANTPCPNAQHDWVVLPGGYWVSHTMCATLTIQAGGKQKDVHIGLGEPCPGQAPPAGPSDR